MGLYSEHVFPRLMDRALGTAAQRELRREALAGARGEVLEIGFGTGLNLCCYPEAVERVVAVDPVPLLEERVRERVRAATVPVEIHRIDAGRGLPFQDRRFPTAVSTWTLCTIEDVDAALAEVRRVLRPDGSFLFMEHGRSDRPLAARLQDLLNPVQNVLGQGCNLNRRIDELVSRAGFEILDLERFRLPRSPRTFGEIYRGVARPREEASPRSRAPAQPPASASPSGPTRKVSARDRSAEAG